MELEWNSSRTLGFIEEKCDIWDHYLEVLRTRFIHLKDEEDVLIWLQNSSEYYSPKEGYKILDFRKR